MNQMKKIYIVVFYIVLTIISIACTVVNASNEESLVISNKMIMERLELYQGLNEKKFELIFNELKNLREDMNRRFELVYKRFEQVDKRFEQVDKRFEQMDKRFEQMDKRFDFMQQIILVMLTFTVATPITIEILRRRREKLMFENRDLINKAFYILNEAAKNDQNIRNAFNALEQNKDLFYQGYFFARAA